jgi:hypothetical protein
VLQLLVYAVGATIASLELKRSRCALMLRFANVRRGFIPAIERPG